MEGFPETDAYEPGSPEHLAQLGLEHAAILMDISFHMASPAYEAAAEDPRSDDTEHIAMREKTKELWEREHRIAAQIEELDLSEHTNETLGSWANLGRPVPEHYDADYFVYNT